MLHTQSTRPCLATSAAPWLLVEEASIAHTPSKKITSKSSTEAELIGLNDISGQILWTWNFLIEQGYDVKASTVYQDNKSAIQLASNSILSSSKHTKHIRVRYYFIKDQIDNEENKYCILPYQFDGRGLLHQALTGIPIRLVPRRHHGHNMLRLLEQGACCGSK